MSEEITLYLQNWNYNAGLTGFVNVIGRENLIREDEQSISFPVKLLDTFQDKYFKYLIDTYEKTLSWYKIVVYREIIEKFEETNFENFSGDSLNQLNGYIKDVVKNYLKSASYKAAYPLIKSSINLLELEKEIHTVGKISKKERFEEKRDEILEEVKDVFKNLKIVIEYCKSEDGRKYLAGKNVIYTIIKNGWNGVSFLNPQTKIIDPYVDYQTHFLEELTAYPLEKDQLKYQCSCCGEPMKNYKNDLSFLNKTGFDTNKKASHVWNFNNDIAVCPMCKLIYSCLPAGFTYVYQQGIFVNANVNMTSLLNINGNIRERILDSNPKETSPYKAYKVLIEGFQEEQMKSTKYVMSDIQVVRYEDETYRFNILSKKTMRILVKSNRQLEYLMKTGFKEATISFSLYKLVMQRLFNNENLFTLIHKTLVFKLSNMDHLYYQLFHINQMLEINVIFLKEVKKMENLSMKQIEYVRKFGEKFKESYKRMSNERKITGISYKLLNALKTNNRDAFMDVLLNCYSYLKAEVPNIFLKIFENDEQFKTLGYSFVSGMIGEPVGKVQTDEKAEE